MSKLLIDSIQSKDIFNKEIYRRNPILYIEIDKIPLSVYNYDKMILKCIISLHDTKISSIELHLSDPHQILLSDKFFSPKKELKVWIGYKETSFVYHGSYILSDPKYKLGSENVLVLMGYDPLIRFTRIERRRKFSGIKYSSIVRSICTAYNYYYDVDETIDVYPSLIQANINDYSFIKDLADRIGYQFYYENGIVNFHPLRLRHLGFFIDHQKNGGLIDNFEADIITEGKYSIFRTTQVNPDTGLSIDVIGSGIPNNFTDISVGVENVESLSNKRYRFIVNKGKLANPSELKNIVDSAYNSSKYVVDVKCECIGVELMKSRRLIALRGLERFSGIYYLKNVIHVLDFKSGSGFKTYFNALRTYSGNYSSISLSDSLGSKRRNVTKKSIYQGTALIK